MNSRVYKHRIGFLLVLCSRSSEHAVGQFQLCPCIISTFLLDSTLKILLAFLRNYLLMVTWIEFACLS